MEPQRRQAMLENFSRNLRLASNPAAADAILAGLSENLSFGYMGKYDVIFRFTQAMTQRVGLETNEPIGPPTPIPNEISVGYDCMNPKTGNVVFSTKNANLEQLSRRFGNIFQLEK